MESTNDTILMKHNIQTYKDAKECMNKHGKVAVVQPTGTGKSYIAMQIMQDMGKCKKVVIAPSRNFLDFMETNKYWDEEAVTLTYSYLARNNHKIEYELESILGTVEDIELIIIDEFHRAGAPEWGKAVNKIIERCSKAKILGLSATPIRSKSNRNMVDELFDGYSVGNTSLCNAIDKKILPKLHYVVGVASANNEIEKMMRLNIENKYFIDKIGDQLTELRDKWSTNNTFKGTLHKYLVPNNNSEYTEGLESRHIVFLTKVKDIVNYTNTIKQWFSEIYTGYNVEIGFIHSKMTKAHNNDVLERFASKLEKNTVRVIVTIQMLNESFHFDSIKSISMFRHTEATNVFIQQIGRALSAKSKPPYIFDFVENFSSVGYSAFLTGGTSDGVENIEGLFESFNDETKSCVLEINEVVKKINSRAGFYTQLLPSLAKQHGSLYDIPDTDLKEWAVKQFQNMRTARNEITKIECFELTKLISESAGEEWYTNYKNFGSLSKEDETRFRRKTRVLYDCNCISPKIQQEISHNTGITFDDKDMPFEYYTEVVDNSNAIECKHISRLVKALRENNKYNAIRYIQKCKNLYKFAGDIKPIFSIHTLDKAYAYKLWETVMKDKKIQALIDYKFTPEQQILQRALKGYSKYGTQTLSTEEFIQLNKKFLLVDIEEHDTVTKEILKYFSISSNERIFAVLDRLAKFSETTETFERKLGLILNGTITNRVAVETLEVDIEKFIGKYKKVELAEYFQEKYDKFENKTLDELQKAINMFKCTSKSMQLVQG